MGKKVGLDHTRSFETMPSNVINMTVIECLPRVLSGEEGVEEWKTSRMLGDQLGIVTLVLTAT